MSENKTPVEKIREDFPILDVNQTVASEPTTESHNDLQNKVNKQREEYFASLPLETRTKYDQIHAAASILNGAKIPFLLIAQAEDGLPIQYSEYSYLPKYTEEDIRISQKVGWDFGRVANIMTSLLFGGLRIGYATPDNVIFHYIVDGKGYSLKPQEEKNENPGQTEGTDKARE
jgi:hypothetical protein